jgi:hypothetical protein
VLSELALLELSLELLELSLDTLDSLLLELELELLELALLEVVPPDEPPQPIIKSDTIAAKGPNCFIVIII